MNILKSRYPQLALGSFPNYRTTTRWIRGGGDLALMLAIQDVVSEEIVETLPDRPLAAAKVDSWVQPQVDLGVPNEPIALEQADRSLARAVLFRDSFGSTMLPYLGESFSRILCLRQYYVDRNVVEREKPDIVFLEMAERSLYQPLPPK